MGQYYIDHYNAEIHHTNFVNDRCTILNVASKHRATLQSEREVARLCRDSGYVKCACCDGLVI
ncbi:hypothetical protein [Salsuginibacillus halophilus]|uniref:hypothetical protein n=1 Tax=Salsuginibacillus halophilus TaxID=517424 RepID=UPI0011B28078|nr:hypothetical protein [Salsuginibacillus halophilus]